LVVIRVPAIVIVPDVVIGPPEYVNPVVPPDTSIEVTVPRGLADHVKAYRTTREKVLATVGAVMNVVELGPF
jgi:hypothetical protein